MDDFGFPVLLQYQQIFVARDKPIRSGGCCQGKEIIVTRISADGFNMRRVEQFGSPEKITELIGVAWRYEVVEDRPIDDFDEFVNSSW